MSQSHNINDIAKALSQVELCCKDLSDQTKQFLNEALVQANPTTTPMAANDIKKIIEQGAFINSASLEKAALLVAALQGPTTFCQIVSALLPQAQDSAPATTWQPRGIRQLTPIQVELPADLETFSEDDIHNNLRGQEWAPGYFFLHTDAPVSNSPLRGRAYWVLEQKYEPFAPSAPGKHAAKLTALLRDVDDDDDDGPEEKDYNNTPVFVKMLGEEGYSYVGHYTQARYSDKLDYDTMDRVPQEVLQYWAAQLTSEDRPAWMTSELAKHFFPAPLYTPPEDDASQSAADEACRTFASLAQQEQRDADMKVRRLTPANILAAFTDPDFGTSPGLRLFWEYLECMHWSEEFYTGMYNLKHHINPNGRVRSRPPKATSRSDGSARQSSPDRMQAAPVVAAPTATSTPATKQDTVPAVKAQFVPPHLRGARA